MFTHHFEVFDKNLDHIVEYGSYKDLCKLVEANVKMTNIIAQKFAEKLKADSVLMQSGADHGYTLAAKYAPSKNKHYDKACPGFLYSIVKNMGYTTKSAEQYRKLLSGLRKKLEIVEQLMCTNHWNSLDLSKMPSCALKLYGKAVKRHAPELMDTFLKKVSEGKAKINVGQLQPHELGGSYISWQGFNGEPANQLVETQWRITYASISYFGGFGCANLSDARITIREYDDYILSRTKVP